MDKRVVHLCIGITITQSTHAHTQSGLHTYSHRTPSLSAQGHTHTPGWRHTAEASAEEKESFSVNLTGSWTGGRDSVCVPLVTAEPCSDRSASQGVVPSDIAEPDMVRERVVAELLLGESILSGSRPPNISLFSLTRMASSRTPSSCESMSAKWKSVDCRQISANSTGEGRGRSLT